MRFPNKFILIAVLLIALTAVRPAYAHRPEDANAAGITRIPDPTTSFAYYRDFESGSYMHIYAVDGTAGEEFHAGINIPQLDGLEEYSVTIGVFGPGLPDLDLQSINLLPHQLGDSGANIDLHGLGGIVAESLETGDFYEPFTQTSYWGRQSIDMTFPATETYYLVVWQAEEIPGKYVLDTGREEVFGIGDLLRFPVWWWNTRAYFGQLPVFWLFSLSAIGLLSVVLLRRRATATRNSQKVVLEKPAHTRSL